MKAAMFNSSLPKHLCFDSCPVSEKRNTHTPVIAHLSHKSVYV